MQGMIQLQQMQMSDPVAPLKARIRETLLAGNTVWFAGLYELPPAGVSMNDLHLPPPPLPERGWASAPYETLWAFQISLFLQTHARSAVTVPTDPGGPLESAELRSFTGWRDEGPKR